MGAIGYEWVSNEMAGWLSNMRSNVRKGKAAICGIEGSISDDDTRP